MTMKARKTTMNTALKAAIVTSGQKTSRRVALRARIPEQRLSDIVHNRVEATERERTALAKALGVSVEQIFPIEATV